MSTHRFAIFGDIGGWYEPFRNALTLLGIDVDRTVCPEDLTIIQLGDLVHRGPESEVCVQVASEFLYFQRFPRPEGTPPQWIQLFGNHEGHHIGGPQFAEPGTTEPYQIDPAYEKILQDMWRDKKAQIACALKTNEYGDLLCTHAGLTSFFLEQYIRTDSVRSVATTLNSMKLDMQFKPGIMLGDRGLAGPAWAAAGPELLWSWKNLPMPFSQVHGHSSAYLWHNDRFYGHVTPEIKEMMHVDKDSHHEFFTNGGKSIIGIDPCFGKYEPHYPIVPLIVTGELYT